MLDKMKYTGWVITETFKDTTRDIFNFKGPRDKFKDDAEELKRRALADAEIYKSDALWKIFWIGISLIVTAFLFALLFHWITK